MQHSGNNYVAVTALIIDAQFICMLAWGKSLRPTMALLKNKSSEPTEVFFGFFFSPYSSIQDDNVFFMVVFLEKYQGLSKGFHTFFLEICINKLFKSVYRPLK